MAVCPTQRRLQRRRRRVAVLGRDAARHAPSARLASTAIPNQRPPSMNAKSAPDLILHNGRITTLDPKYPEAKNVAIKDGRIVGVDDAESLHHPCMGLGLANVTFWRGHHERQWIRVRHAQRPRWESLGVP